MTIRYLKVILVAFVSILALFYATQNMVNLDEVFFFVSQVTGMVGHEAYPSSFGPAITNPTLIKLAIALILLGEYACGFLAAKGAWDLWQARSATAAKFNQAKKYAILGCGVGLIVWFGIFTVIGGAYFQMWQTDLGRGSLEGAFQFLGSIGLILIFVNMKDE